MPSAAPNDAPYSTPNRLGETRGLMNMDWKVTPETESAAPISMAAKILGMRISTRMLCRIAALWTSIEPNPQDEPT